MEERERALETFVEERKHEQELGRELANLRNSCGRASQKKASSIDIRMVEEDSIRTSNDFLVQVPDETPFPEGFEVMHESILTDGDTYRLWNRKQP